MTFKEIVGNPLYIAIVLYILVIVLIVYTKPKMFFDEDGKIKQTGCGKNKVIFSFPMFIVISSILIYFLIKIMKTKLEE